MRGPALLALATLSLAAHAVADTLPGERLTLEQAYQHALSRSEAVRLADSDLARADVVAREAWTLLGPSAAITGQGVLQRQIKIPDGMGGETVAQVPAQLLASATLNQPVLRRGFFPTRRAGLAGIESSRAAAERAREQLHYDVATNFLQVLKSRRLIEVARANRERTDAQLKVANVKKSLGEVVKSAVVQAQIDVLRADRQLSDAQAALDDASATFERLVGIAPPELAPPEPPVSPPVAAALARAATRSDVRALRAAALQSAELVTAADGPLWPTVDLQGAVTEAWPQPTFTFNPSGFNWSARVILTVPLFQSGDEYYRRRLARIDALAAGLRVQLLEKTAREDVARALAALSGKQRLFAIAEQQVAQSRENYALVQAQFKNGRGTSTDVVVAESTLAEAESQQAVAAYERDQTSFQLLFVAGLL